MPNLPTYVLVTPARDEAQFVELTIQSVVAQTVRPLKWVIVSDGSTDGTDEIVNRYASAHPWIELLRMPERRINRLARKARLSPVGHDRAQESQIGRRQGASIRRYRPGRWADQAGRRVCGAVVGVIH